MVQYSAVRRPQRKGNTSAGPLLSEKDGPPQESWDHVASWYDSLAADRGTEFHQELIIPGLLLLLKLQPREKVLDLACGQGVVSRALHRSGAQVTGVDLSPRLITMARQRSPKAVRYLVGDARHLDTLPDQGFDAIVSILAAQNIDPLEPLFAECARLLRQGGRLVMAITHPAFRIPRHSGWKWDEERRMLLREVERYLTPMKIPIDMRPFKMPRQKLTWT